MAAYLLLSVAGAATSSQLLTSINNFFYFGITQSLPGILGILFIRRMRPGAIIVGMLAGDIAAIALYQLHVPLGGANPGFVGLLLNLGIVFSALYFAPGTPRPPVAKLELPR